MTWRHLLTIALLALFSALFVDRSSQIALTGVGSIFALAALRDALYSRPPRRRP